MVGGGGAPEQGERMFEETGLRPGELSLDYQSEASCDGAPSADSDAEDSAEGGDDTPPQAVRRPPRRGPSPRENGPSLNPTWD